MAGQAKLSRLTNKYAVISSGSTVLNVGWKYHITASGTYILPTTDTLSIGDAVRFTKDIILEPIIQAASVDIINTSIGTDTSVIYDINAEIIFVWKGTQWEV